MTLDEPRETDKVYEIDGVKIIFDQETSRYANGFEIDYRNSILGKRFSVSQLYNNGGSCH